MRTSRDQLGDGLGGDQLGDDRRGVADPAKASDADARCHREGGRNAGNPEGDVARAREYSPTAISLNGSLIITMFPEVRYACRYRAVKRKVLPSLRFWDDTTSAALVSSNLPSRVWTLFATQSSVLRILRPRGAR